MKKLNIIIVIAIAVALATMAWIGLLGIVDLQTIQCVDHDMEIELIGYDQTGGWRWFSQEVRVPPGKNRLMQVAIDFDYGVPCILQMGISEMRTSDSDLWIADNLAPTAGQGYTVLYYNTAGLVVNADTDYYIMIRVWDPTTGVILGFKQSDYEYCLDDSGTLYASSGSGWENPPGGDLNIWVTVGRWNDPPYRPSNPNPASGTTNIPLSTSLSWTGGDPDGDTVYYDVYFGTNPTPSDLVSSYQSGTSYNPPGDLNGNTLYYWRIEAEDQHGEPANPQGPIWNFRTESGGTETYTLTIHAKDANTEASLPGVTVTIDGVAGSQTTGADGLCSFIDLPSGSYNIHGSLVGYSDNGGIVDWILNENPVTHSTNLWMYPEGAEYCAYTFTVYEVGSPTRIIGANVTCNEVSILTNTQGESTFSLEKNTPYSVSVVASGYLTQDFTITTGSADEQNYDVDMISGEGLLGIEWELILAIIIFAAFLAAGILAPVYPAMKIAIILIGVVIAIMLYVFMSGIIAF